MIIEHIRQERLVIYHIQVLGHIQTLTIVFDFSIVQMHLQTVQSFRVAVKFTNVILMRCLRNLIPFVVGLDCHSLGFVVRGFGLLDIHGQVLQAFKAC